MAEKVRKADARSPKRWAIGCTTSSKQKTLGYDVAAKRVATVEQTMLAAASEAKWTGRRIARCSSRRTQKTTRNVELGGGLDSGDGGDYVIGIGEVEEQVPAKVGRTHGGRAYEARSSLSRIVKNQRRSTYIFPPSTLSKYVLTNFQILEAPTMSAAPEFFFL